MGGILSLPKKLVYGIVYISVYIVASATYVVALVGLIVVNWAYRKLRRIIAWDFAREPERHFPEGSNQIDWTEANKAIAERMEEEGYHKIVERAGGYCHPAFMDMRLDDAAFQSRPDNDSEAMYMAKNASPREFGDSPSSGQESFIFTPEEVEVLRQRRMSIASAASSERSSVRRTPTGTRRRSVTFDLGNDGSPRSSRSGSPGLARSRMTTPVRQQTERSIFGRSPSRNS